MSPSIATPEHALFCFDVLAAHLHNSPAKPQPNFTNAGDPYAVFVTWDTLRKGREPSLRGCIGNFSPKELGEQLRSYAVVA